MFSYYSDPVNILSPHLFLSSLKGRVLLDFTELFYFIYFADLFSICGGYGLFNIEKWKKHISQKLVILQFYVV